MTEKEAINGALPTSGHLPMYVMHKFFARKQEDVIREYIQAFSKKEEIVCDPFCGSGVMIGEAIRLGRKAVGIDINPVSIFITKNTLKHISDLNRIIEEFHRIKAEVKTDITRLYQTTCRNCGKNIAAICFTWKDKDPIDVRYECPEHGRNISPVNELDLKLLNKIEDGEIIEFFDDDGDCRYWYPVNKFYYNDKTPFLKKERFNSVDEIFSKRNLISLAKLYDQIKKIDDLELQEVFKFAFSSMTHLASKMTPVRPSRPYSSAWVQQSYWYCPNNMESNVWNLFERAVIGRQGLVKAKENLSESFKKKTQASSFKELIKGQNNDYLLIESSINNVEEIKEDSVDLVITDPPYGYSIQYGELLYMWGCWLQLMDNFDDIARGEIITNPRQKKSDVEYERMLKIAFKKIFQWLKPESYCIVTFHNPNLKYRNILFRSVLLNGFEFEKIVYQPPPRASAKSFLQPFGSQRGDYFFRFRKPRWRNDTISYKSIDANQVEELIVDITKRILVERGEPTCYTDIQNMLDPILYEKLKKSQLLMDFNPENIEKILKRHVGDIFEVVDVDIEGIGNQKLQGKGWWLINSKKNG
ncbi:MAG: DNA adenine methylase [Candidatus Heimdallarchaeota archaeon]|nr:MAG: DNA adenine methylase [Candidatus Heimdallarchaeota archaeon]